MAPELEKPGPETEDGADLKTQANLPERPDKNQTAQDDAQTRETEADAETSEANGKKPGVDAKNMALPDEDSGGDDKSSGGQHDGEADDWGTSWNAWDGSEAAHSESPAANDASSLAANDTSPSTSAAKSGSKEYAKEEPGGEPMGLLDHLGELRIRLTKAVIAVAVGFAICWAFVDPLFNLLLKPLLDVLPEGTHAQYTTLPEAFFTRMHIAFVAGAFFASPAIFYQIWAFVAPGLYDEEKRYILPIALLSAVFFIAGGLFCYCIVFPFAFNFFISYSTPEIVITPKISDYLSFSLKLIFAFGLIFEMPIFTFFLARFGILTAAMMRKARGYAIVGIFILAAILTPPDVISQLLMACPMLLLYEVSIGVALVFGRKPKKKTEEENGKTKT